MNAIRTLAVRYLDHASVIALTLVFGVPQILDARRYALNGAPLWAAFEVASVFGLMLAAWTACEIRQRGRGLRPIVTIEFNRADEPLPRYSDTDEITQRCDPPRAA